MLYSITYFEKGQCGRSGYHRMSELKAGKILLKLMLQQQNKKTIRDIKIETTEE